MCEGIKGKKDVVYLGKGGNFFVNKALRIRRSIVEYR